MRLHFLWVLRHRYTSSSCSSQWTTKAKSKFATVSLDLYVWVISVSVLPKQTSCMWWYLSEMIGYVSIGPSRTFYLHWVANFNNHLIADKSLTDDSPSSSSKKQAALYLALPSQFIWVCGLEYSKQTSYIWKQSPWAALNVSVLW